MIQQNKKNKTSTAQLEKSPNKFKDIQPISNGRNLGNKYLAQLKSILPKR